MTKQAQLFEQLDLQDTNGQRKNNHIHMNAQNRQVEYYLKTQLGESNKIYPSQTGVARKYRWFLGKSHIQTVKLGQSYRKYPQKGQVVKSHRKYSQKWQLVKKHRKYPQKRPTHMKYPQKGQLVKSYMKYPQMGQLIKSHRKYLQKA